MIRSYQSRARATAFTKEGIGLWTSFGRGSLWRYQTQFTSSAEGPKVSRQLDVVRLLDIGSSIALKLVSQQGFHQLFSIHLDPDRRLAYHNLFHCAPDKLMLFRDLELRPVLAPDATNAALLAFLRSL
jgi:hypothetical protein